MSPVKRWRDMRKSDITLEQLVGRFEVANRAEGKSLATLRGYEQNLDLFL